jgi:hypothetical protein
MAFGHGRLVTRSARRKRDAAKENRAHLAWLARLNREWDRRDLETWA